MKVIGLTGSIGMGKSTVAKMFADAGAPGFNSDDAVHQLYARGGEAVAPVGQAFPGTIVDGAVDRAALSAALARDPGGFKRLEAIVHPLVRERQLAFMRASRAAGAQAVVLDIPLLFESGAEKNVDVVVVVSAPPHIQRERVLARPGMRVEKFEQLLARQTPDAEKRARADYIIDTSGSLDATRARVSAVLDALRERG